MSELLHLIELARARRASDLHLVVGLPPAVRVHGSLLSLAQPALASSRPLELLREVAEPAQLQRLERERGLCFSLLEGGTRRARVTAYYHRGAVELAVRLCAREVGDAEELGLPPAVSAMAHLAHGLVLICGRNGAGKTTTLNYLIDAINRERCCKVITIEDPVEYVHRPRRSLIVQQEIPGDALSFPQALAHALRQCPDVLVIGEMRDPETIATALNAAETGHLVLATLHTATVGQSVERLTGVFPPAQQRQVTLQLASTLQAAVIQELVPRADGEGRVLACEVLVATPSVRSLIRSQRAHLLENVVATGRKEGMQTMDQSLLDLYHRALITHDAAQSRLHEPRLLLEERVEARLAAWRPPAPAAAPAGHAAPPVQPPPTARVW